MTFLPTTTCHVRVSNPWRLFQSPCRDCDFRDRVQEASILNQANVLPNPLSNPHLECLMGAAHGTMSPSFVFGDNIHLENRLYGWCEAYCVHN